MNVDAAPSVYPLRVEGELDAHLSRWLWLVKWVLIIPHVIALVFLWVALVVLTVVAFFAILLTGRYPRAIHPGAFNLTDDTEINTINTTLRSTSITLTPSYTSPPTPQAGVMSLFTLPVDVGSGGLDQPTATFTLPANTTLDSIRIGTGDLDCDAPSGGQVQCRLPSGTSTKDVLVRVTPSAAAVGSPMTLDVAVRALNAPQATGTATSPNVAP